MVATIDLFDNVSVLRTESVNLAVNASTTALAPTFATLMTGSITTTEVSSYLAITWTGGIFHTGGFAGNAAFNVRFRVDGSLFTTGAGTAGNQLRNRIENLAYQRRTIVSAGTHVVIVEWARFGGGLNAIEIRAASLPQLFHAHLTLQEHKL